MTDEPQFYIAGMKAIPYEPIVVPGDPDNEWVEFGPVTFISLDGDGDDLDPDS